MRAEINIKMLEDSIRGARCINRNLKNELKKEPNNNLLLNKRKSVIKRLAYYGQLKEKLEQ